jgi:polysaccharide export outer membrane protein
MVVAGLLTEAGCRTVDRAGDVAVDKPSANAFTQVNGGMSGQSGASNAIAGRTDYAVKQAGFNAPIPGAKAVRKPPVGGVEVRGQDCGGVPADLAVPRELQKITLQPYVLEPPDILLIDVVRAVPKSPYVIEALDALQIVVEGTVEGQPIAGIYAVNPGGMVQLGPAYGGVMVKGLSLTEARDAIERQLRASLTDARVSVSLAQSGGQQQIVGEHLIGLDGTVNLGSYGSVYITGMTLVEARAAIERHLSKYLDAPKVSLDVFAYNSKVYYVIIEGAGQGDRVTRLPVTGNETVLDAISNIGGLTQFSSKNIWIARPAPGGVACDQVLPVKWKEITRGGSTATNYQVLPGDRIFISEDRMIAADSVLERLIRPFERIMGFTALSAQTMQNLQRFPEGFTNGF